MKLAMNWNSSDNCIPIEYIKQVPCVEGISTGIRTGDPYDLLPQEEIMRIRSVCSGAGLSFEIFESLRVHDDIKLGNKNRDKRIDTYIRNIEMLSRNGIKYICYGFMPAIDWARTDVAKKMPDGSTCLEFDYSRLKLDDAISGDISMDKLSGPSSEEMKKKITAYQELGEEGLWKNLEYFLKAVMPVAAKNNIIMAIHPDDPPFSMFGIPRIVTSEKNIDRLLSIVPDKANSITLCVGSFACLKTNDVIKMAEKYSSMERVGFVHMRNLKIFADKCFVETAHPSTMGCIDMYKIADILTKNNYSGYVRPDHGRMIWNDSGESGHGLYDRALGAAYLNGLFEACRENIKQKR